MTKKTQIEEAQELTLEISKVALKNRSIYISMIAIRAAFLVWRELFIKEYGEDEYNIITSGTLNDRL